MRAALDSGSRAAFAVPAAVAVLGLALFLPRLGASGLWDPWEPRYAGTARAMVASGDWVVPRYLGEPRMVKPPLTYWLIAASQSVFGDGETASRLPSVLLAVACAAGLAAAFAARGRALEGALAGGALLTCPQWLLLGRAATPDVPLGAVLGLLLALAIAAPRWTGARGRRAVFAAVVASLSAAALIDWPRGLVLPGWAVLAWAAQRARGPWLGLLAAAGALYFVGQRLYSAPLTLLAFGLVAAGSALALRRLAGVEWRPQLLALGAVALVVAPWFAAVVRLEPEASVPRLFGYKYGLNLGEAPGEHTGPIGFVFAVVAAGALPWIGAALAGWFVVAVRRDDDVAGLLAGGWVGAVAFFALSEARMGHFYALVQPATAGLAAVGLGRMVRARGSGVRAPVLVAAGGVAATWTVVWLRPTLLVETLNVFSDLHGLVDPRPWLSLAIVAWFATAGLAIARHRPAWMLATLAPAALFAVYLGLIAVPALETKKSARALWRSYIGDRAPGEGLCAAEWTKDSLFYYSRDEVRLLDDPAALREYLRGPGARYLIAPDSALPAVRRAAGPGARIRARDESHPDLVLVRVEPPG